MESVRGATPQSPLARQKKKEGAKKMFFYTAARNRIKIGRGKNRQENPEGEERRRKE